MNAFPGGKRLYKVRPTLMVSLLLTAALTFGSAPKQAQNSPKALAQVGAPASPPAAAKWSISAGHSVVWNGNREVLAGLRIDGTPEDVAQANRAGFKDLCVELPSTTGSNWAPTIAALEASGSKYLISINSLAPLADAIAVDPEGYRIPAITTARHISIKIPGATSVIAILAVTADGSVQWTKRIPTPDGQLELDADPDSDIDHVLLLYPRLSSSDLIDCWEGFDQSRDSLMATLQRSKPGPNCRGLINPVGASAHLFGGQIDSIPTSPIFQMQLRSYLENRYHNIDTAISSWSMRSSSVDSFDRLAKLVPLWSGAKGIPGLYDQTTGEVVQVDPKQSLAWEDIRTVILTSARSRFRHLVDAIHSVAEIPVVQEWNGWSLPYEGTPVVDGIGLVTDGSSPSTLLEEAGRGASSIMRWNHPGWLVASRIDGLDNATAVEMQHVTDDLASLGARAYFLHSYNPEAIKKWAEVVKDIKATPPPDDAVQPLYFPENAYNPAEPQSLAGGIFWLPSPEAGDRFDFGTKIRGYTVGAFDGQKAILWSPGGIMNVRFLMAEPKRAQVTNGVGVAQPFHTGKAFLEVQLSPNPIVISGINELPVPDSAAAETQLKVDQLLAVGEELHRDISADAFAYRDGQASLSRTPGPAYFSMRKAYTNLSQMLADYTWIEAENAKTYTLGEPVDLPGCSGGRAFSVRSRLSLPGQIYRVDFPVRPRSGSEQEVWVAAKVSPGDKSKVRVVVGSQSLSLTGPPISSYSSGFAWYKCGVTRLGGEAGTVALEIDGSTGVDVVIDTILLTPRSFTPNGTIMPDAIVYSDKLDKKSRGKRG